MQRNAIVGFNTFLFPLLTNYVYHLHNYVKIFLPFKQRLAAGVLSSLLPPAVALLVCSFSRFPWLTRTPSYAGYSEGNNAILISRACVPHDLQKP